ncbi:MAG: BMP family ABC transporter substrate-binding protein [Treponema sp.]|nr:BMP family ABC transporter substrate-binding protein [Treponema sp.]
MKRIFLVLLATAFMFTGCSNKKAESKVQKKSLAVFVPGIMADSPIYAKLAEGAQKAVEEYNKDKSDAEKADIYVMEAGTNQAEWGPKITSLAATGKYDVIISSNPSLPGLVEPICNQFPKQKFILLDAEMSGNDKVFTVAYEQTEEAYLTGYIAGLMSKNHKVALVAAQDYPAMNNVLYPNFERGAKDAVEGTTCDYRVVGNWYDASKGMEISESLIKTGVDVILPICGGASQGVIASAVNNGTYITWFDSNGFSKAPGTIISSAMVVQDKMTFEVTMKYLKDSVNWGTAEKAGLKEGYIEFIEDDPLYIETVPEDVRAKMNALIKELQSK